MADCTSKYAPTCSLNSSSVVFITQSTSVLKDVVRESVMMPTSTSQFAVVKYDLNSLDKVSLLTVDEYRKYRKYLPNTDKWWWLCTPWSTKCNGYEYIVAVVAPSGNVCNDGCNCSRGVRPVCIFPFSIFESEEK